MEDITATIPVYNEEKYIENAVESIVHQVKEVIICDNCSTDATVEILKKLADKYKNITLILQDKNYGVVHSFKVLYTSVKTKFVMHMGAHDIVEDNYIETLMPYMLQNDVAMACATVEHIDINGTKFDYDDLHIFKENLESENPFKRVHTIIENLRDCSLFYGIMRTKYMKKYMITSTESHADHVLLTQMALEGKYKISNKTRFYRRYLDRDDSQEEYMKRLQGEYANTSKGDLRFMIRSQLEIVDTIESSNQEEKNFYSQLARDRLKERLSGKGGRVDYRPFIDQLLYQKNTLR